MNFLSLFALVVAATASAATNLQFVGMTAQSAVPLKNGDILAVGSTGQYPNATVLDSSGTQVKNFDALAGFGNGTGRILVAAADPSGNIWIAGQTDSDDFPLVHPLFAQKLPYRSTGFVAKLDPDFNVLFSTFLGGTSSLFNETGAVPTGIVLSASGDVYVAGYLGQHGFPTTGPVLGTGTPGTPTNGFSPLVYSFVTKIAADGSKLLISVLLGGDQSSCPSNSCLEAPSTTVSALAVDSEGIITVAGGTTAINFPVTAGVYQSDCGCSNGATNGFVARISADASRLIWATYFGKGAANASAGDFIQSIALDSTGNVDTVGTTHGGIVTPTGALQPSLPATGQASGFMAKVSSDGTKLLFGTNLGGSLGATLTGFTLDSTGDIWIAGNTASPDFPGLAGTPASGLDFALELNADASALQQIFRLVPGTVTQPPAFDSSGNLLLLSSKGNLLRLDPNTALTTPGVFAVANAAVLTADPGVAAGEIATFFGVGIGPPAGVVGTANAQGFYPTRLGGVHVVFETSGLPPIPAPLLYVGPNQINFQVPFRALGGSTVTVTTPTTTLAPIQMPSIPSIGVFHQAGSDYAAALNQDLSVNSASNPAKPGSIVSLYTTSGICGDPLEPNGAVSKVGDHLPFITQGIAVTVLGSSFFQPLPVFYFGPAPGIINGVCQLNVQLPLNENPILVINTIAESGGNTNAFQFDASSNPVQIHTQ